MAARARSDKTNRKAARPPSRRAPARPAGGRGAPSRRALEQSLAEALEQQAATSNILQVISRSPTALQPVLDAVVENAVRFCGADDASLFRVEGDRLRGDAHHGPVHQPPGFRPASPLAHQRHPGPLEDRGGPHGAGPRRLRPPPPRSRTC